MASGSSGFQWGRTTRSSTPRDTDNTIHKTIPKVIDDDITEVKQPEPQEPLETSRDEEVSENGGESNITESESGLQASIEELKSTIDKLTNSLRHVDSKFEAQDRQLNYLYNRTKQLENSNKYLMNRVEALENQRKVLNIKLDGVKESTTEDLFATVLNLANDMGSTCKRQDIDSVYRLGRRATPHGRPRSVTNRKQSVLYNNKYSDKLHLSTGVPQGSTLGPLLFLMYINDMPDILLYSKCLLFADDTVLYIGRKEKEIVYPELQLDLDAVFA